MLVKPNDELHFRNCLTGTTSAITIRITSMHKMVLPCYSKAREVDLVAGAATVSYLPDCCT